MPRAAVSTRPSASSSAGSRSSRTATGDNRYRMPENAYSTRGWRRRNSHSPDSKIKTATTAMPNGLKVGTGGGGSPVPIMNSRSGVTFPVTLVKLETGVNSMKDWVGSTSPGSSPRELAWAPCKTLGLVEEKAVLTLFASRLLQLVESVHSAGKLTETIVGLGCPVVNRSWYCALVPEKRNWTKTNC